MEEQRFDVRRWGRWVGTFVGFPLAGVAARLVAGPIDSVGAATLGGLAGGLVLGGVQAAVGQAAQGATQRRRWIGATAGGLAAGLAAGAATVGYRTDTASLIVMGALSGVGVGLGQALAVPMRRIDRLAWVLTTPALWAGGWAITSQVIVDAERQHAVFGASGALVVSALAGLAHVLRRPPASTASGAGASSARPTTSTASIRKAAA